MTDIITKNEQIDIKNINGRTQITFKQAILKGKVSQDKLLSTIMIAAQMHVEKLIEKLSRGAPLESHEVKALKELADIAKIEVAPKEDTTNVVEQTNPKLLEIKEVLYKALTEKNQS